MADLSTFLRKNSGVKPAVAAVNETMGEEDLSISFAEYCALRKVAYEYWTGSAWAVYSTEINTLTISCPSNRYIVATILPRWYPSDQFMSTTRYYQSRAATISARFGPSRTVFSFSNTDSNYQAVSGARSFSLQGGVGEALRFDVIFNSTTLQSTGFDYTVQFLEK